MNQISPGEFSLVVNMFRLKQGISQERFMEFSSTIDQPLVLAHSNIVHRFDVFAVGGATAEALDADIIELMGVTDWDNWVQVRDHDPSLRPVTAGFEELVEHTSIRSSFVSPISKGQS